MINKGIKIFYRIFPHLFWQKYHQKARQLGIKKLSLTLSFDCDSDEDILAAQKIHQWLKVRGVMAVFAVPGYQLKKGQHVYRRLVGENAEFINHGALPHTIWKNNSYESITFYHQMNSQIIQDDIYQGHEIVTKIIGKEPKGFRAPHFGHFQKPHQINFLHSVLRSLGYHYDSSTEPNYALKYGPYWRNNDIIEIPVSGSFSSPLTTFDSWTYLISPSQLILLNSYKNTFIKTIHNLQKLNICGLLNYYVDPAHVQGDTSFFDAITFALENGIEILSFSQWQNTVTNPLYKKLSSCAVL